MRVSSVLRTLFVLKLVSPSLPQLLALPAGMSVTSIREKKKTKKNLLIFCIRRLKFPYSVWISVCKKSNSAQSMKVTGRLMLRYWLFIQGMAGRAFLPKFSWGIEISAVLSIRDLYQYFHNWFALLCVIHWKLVSPRNLYVDVLTLSVLNFEVRPLGMTRFRWSHAGSAFMLGLSHKRKRHNGSRALSVSKCTPSGMASEHREVSYPQARKQALIMSRICGHLDLRLLNFQYCEI